MKYGKKLNKKHKKKQTTEPTLKTYACNEGCQYIYISIRRCIDSLMQSEKLIK